MMSSCRTWRARSSSSASPRMKASRWFLSYFAAKVEGAVRKQAGRRMAVLITPILLLLILFASVFSIVPVLLLRPGGGSDNSFTDVQQQLGCQLRFLNRIRTVLAVIPARIKC